jgi:hypothetical protein
MTLRQIGTPITFSKFAADAAMPNTVTLQALIHPMTNGDNEIEFVLPRAIPGAVVTTQTDQQYEVPYSLLPSSWGESQYSSDLGFEIKPYRRFSGPVNGESIHMHRYGTTIPVFRLTFTTLAGEGVFSPFRYTVLFSGLNKNVK